MRRTASRSCGRVFDGAALVPVDGAGRVKLSLLGVRRVAAELVPLGGNVELHRQRLVGPRRHALMPTRSRLIGGTSIRQVPKRQWMVNGSAVAAGAGAPGSRHRT